jgi:hypothetical protein
MGNSLFGVRVKLLIPDDAPEKGKSAKFNGEYIGYDGSEGTLLGPASHSAAWVRFDSQKNPNNYVGCPAKYLKRIE